MKKTLTFLPLLAFWGLALTVDMAEASQQSSARPASQTYVWDGEMVALDQANHSISVKAQVVGDQAREAVSHFKPGEHVTLTWSGFDDHAYYVRDAAASEHAKKGEESFSFPAEFLSSDTTATGIAHITFKTEVPAGSLASLKSLKPGDWVTVTARQNPANEGQAIVAVRPFVTTSATGTN